MDGRAVPRNLHRDAPQELARQAKKAGQEALESLFACDV